MVWDKHFFCTKQERIWFEINISSVLIKNVYNGLRETFHLHQTRTYIMWWDKYFSSITIYTRRDNNIGWFTCTGSQVTGFHLNSASQDYSPRSLCKPQFWKQWFPIFSQFTYHLIILSSYHLIILSSYHLIILSSYLYI